jgi:hypothetical protein
LNLVFSTARDHWGWTRLSSSSNIPKSQLRNSLKYKSSKCNEALVICWPSLGFIIPPQFTAALQRTKWFDINSAKSLSLMFNTL